MKYSKKEKVFVRIPAKQAGVPNGKISQVTIHGVDTWKNETYYSVISAKYGMLKFKEEDIYKHRKDVK